MPIGMSSGREFTLDKRKLKVANEKSKRASKEVNRLPEEHFNLAAIVLEDYWNLFGHISKIDRIQDIVINELVQALCRS